MSAAADVMDDVVTRLVAQIEAGAGTWRMPWRQLDGGFPTNAATRQPYRGGNVIAFLLAQIERGYPTGRWATYQQWASIGAQVRRGEHGTRGLIWRVTDNGDEPGDEPGDERRKRRVFARTFVVFNAAQVDTDPADDLPTLERSDDHDAWFGAIPANVAWGAGQPCYVPAADRVVMPIFDAFDSPADAYATLAHELAHWTGHPTRLARDLSGRFGDAAYAAEELVAELSAAFTCGLLGLNTVERTDHAAYLAAWCRMLREQPGVLWTVASKAQAATDHLASYPAATQESAA